MIKLKTQDEIELIRKSSLLVAKTHAEVAKHIRPGITTKSLDVIAETFIRDHEGAKPAFKGYGGFPATLCISENEQIVHGFPSDREIKEGDILSIDCGVEWEGYFGDSAFTYPVGDQTDEVWDLLIDTIDSLYVGIDCARIGNRIGDVSYAIQKYTEIDRGYGVVRELVGHGVGSALHESPDVPNYGKRGRGPKIKEGLVIAIEPMINAGSRKVKQLNDGWTIITADGKPSAHFEHTVAVTKNGPDILSDFEVIFESIKSNPNIKDFKEKVRYLQTNFQDG
ncbi:MAG: type I methionyl aminopeptidase [Saprospiraceae bacterium]|nr:type I methionyl aminopeptidase [Saprospiraceae bacterium]